MSVYSDHNITCDSPGMKPFQKEIIDVFGVNPGIVGRRSDIILARFCWRFILSIYKQDKIFENELRHVGKNVGYAYSYDEIKALTGAKHQETVSRSIRRAVNLIETDREYSRKVQEVINRILFKQYISQTFVTLKRA